jgi:hypothetical protein
MGAAPGIVSLEVVSVLLVLVVDGAEELVLCVVVVVLVVGGGGAGVVAVEVVVVVLVVLGFGWGALALGAARCLRGVRRWWCDGAGAECTVLDVGVWSTTECLTLCWTDVALDWVLTAAFASLPWDVEESATVVLVVVVAVCVADSG